MSEPADSDASIDLGDSGLGAGPSAVDTRFTFLAAAMAMAAVILGISHSWLANLASLLSLAALLYSLHTSHGDKLASQGRSTDGQAPAMGSSSSRWSLTLVKAEWTQDPWQATGESMEMGSLAGEEEGEAGDEEGQKQTRAQQLGLTPDQWQRYMVGFHSDEAAARKAAMNTQEWRKKYKLPEDSSVVPQPNFEEIKSWFRHGVLCTTHDKNPVWLMKVGDMKKGWQKLKASDLDNSDINKHIGFCMDYLYNHLDTRELPNGRALWLIDLKGMGMTDIGSDAFNFGKEIAETIGRNFPERVTRIFIVHVPGFFSLLWRIVEPLLAANTRRKIRLLRSQADMLREMKEEMNEADIPTEYGGQNSTALYDSSMEVELFKYVSKLNSA